MLYNFSSYISQEKLLKKEESVLLSVSGGIDSMVMCHLFIKADFAISIAHIDHNTRNGESSEDAIFVKEFARNNGLPFYSSEFKYDNSKNFQATARNHRYAFLEKVRKEKKIDKIATAHHINDVAESVLMNLGRGCGLAGLSGISSKTEHIVRPLLFADKEAIEKYAFDEDIAFRMDESNDDTKYRRNAFRHNVIPELEKINASSVVNICRTSDNIKDEWELMRALIEVQKSNFVITREQDMFILNLKAIKAFPGSLSLLFHLCKSYLFNRDQLSSMLTADTGSQFLNQVFKATVNRDQLIIVPNVKMEPFGTEINGPGTYSLDADRSIELMELKPEHVKYSSNYQYFDKAKIVFPIQVRSWQHKDVFCPLGMNGQHQKIQDYFVNNKFSALDKERALLIESNNQIIAILGHRIDDRFKIDSDTSSVIAIKLRSPKEGA